MTEKSSLMKEEPAIMTEKPKNYDQHFREAWLRDERFKDWLVPVLGNTKKASCRFCKCSLNAKKHALRKHLATAKHKRESTKTHIHTHAQRQRVLYSVSTLRFYHEPSCNRGYFKPSCKQVPHSICHLRSGKSIRSRGAQLQVLMDLSQEKIGFIGAGNMAYGIAQGILKSGEILPDNFTVSAPSANNFQRFQELGVSVTHSNEEVVSRSRVVFLAVKPHLIATVIHGISDRITRQHIIVSMAAGVTLQTLEGLLEDGVCVVRMMPNLPCVLQEGALLLARGKEAGPEAGSLLLSLLSPCGLVEEGPEAWIDAHTGLSGSGVAFVYVFAEALADGAVKMGMPSALAQRIAAQTILGAGQLLRDSGKHPAQLRSEVCTPGGTTVFGLHALERAGLRAAAMGAVEAATERARELGQK